MGILDAPGITPAKYRQQRARELRSVTRPTLSGTSDADPTITLGASNAASQIANSQRYASTVAGRFRFRGGTMAVGTTGGYTDMQRVTSPTDPPVTSVPFSVEFAVDSKKVEIHLGAFGASFTYRVWVDGRIIPGPLLNGARSATSFGNSGYLLLLDWGTAAPPWGKRTVRIDLSGAAFGGVYAPKEARVCLPATPPLQTAVWLGDSFFEGTNADNAFASIPHVASPLLGWDNVVSASQGGTGYINPSATSGRSKFLDRVPAVTAQKPDHIVVGGGYNDYLYNPGSGAVTYTDIANAATALFAALRAGSPNAQIWAVGPWNLYTPPDPSRTTIGNSVKAAVEAVGGTYIDMYTDPWITGTGTAASPASPLNGNASLYVTSSSDPHPPPAGHIFYGYEIAAAIAAKLAA